MIKRIVIVLVLAVSGLIGQTVNTYIDSSDMWESAPVDTFEMVWDDTPPPGVFMTVDKFTTVINHRLILMAGILDLLKEYRESVKPDTARHEYIRWDTEDERFKVATETILIMNSISFEGFIEWLENKVKDGEQ